MWREDDEAGNGTIYGSGQFQPTLGDEARKLDLRVGAHLW